jgi:acyl-coenzyme A thioesterase PaaI-like protein
LPDSDATPFAGSWLAEPTETDLAKRELADALRQLLHSLGRSGATPDEIRAFAAQIREGREQLGRTARVASSGEGDGKPFLPGMEDFLDRSPITGQANPIAPPAVLRRDMAARRVTGEVTFDAAFEGAPGIVHGGFVAALLDEALGMATIFSGSTGMTVELVTRYRRHTPVSTPLRLEARLVSVEGRRILTSGELLCGDEVIVEASGLFIAVDSGKFAALAAARAERGEGPGTSGERRKR